MRRAMIDTMIFDAVSDDGEAGNRAVQAAIRFGRLRLLTTHVQEGQLADIGDPVRRKRLQRLPREVVPSGAPVLGVARSGRARLGPSAETDAVVRGPRHARDEVIAIAALQHADVLVTEDRRLARDARERGLPVWTAAELMSWAAQEIDLAPGN